MIVASISAEVLQRFDGQDVRRARESPSIRLLDAWRTASLYDGHLVRREHVERPSSVHRRFVAAFVADRADSFRAGSRNARGVAEFERDKASTDKMSVVHGENGCRPESAGWSRRPLCTTDILSVASMSNVRRLGSSHAQQSRSRGGRTSRQSVYHEAHEEHEGIRE